MAGSSPFLLSWSVLGPQQDPGSPEALPGDFQRNRSASKCESLLGCWGFLRASQRCLGEPLGSYLSMLGNLQGFSQQYLRNVCSIRYQAIWNAFTSDRPLYCICLTRGPEQTHYKPHCLLVIPRRGQTSKIEEFLLLRSPGTKHTAVAPGRLSLSAETALESRPCGQGLLGPQPWLCLDLLPLPKG